MNKDTRQALMATVRWFEDAEMDITPGAWRMAEPILNACKKALEHDQGDSLTDEQIHNGIKSTTDFEIPPYNAGFTAGVRYAEKHFGVEE